MRRVLPRRKMDETVQPARLGRAIKRQRVTAAVDDDQRPRLACERLNQRIIAHRASVAQGDALELARQSRGIGREFPPFEFQRQGGGSRKGTANRRRVESRCRE